jgi:hypothetical protein
MSEFSKVSGAITADEEAVARVLAKGRNGGIDVEQPITVGSFEDGVVVNRKFQIGWHGYVETAREIIAALEASSKGDK